MFDGMSLAVVHNTLNLTATWRAFVQTAFGTTHRARFAAFIGKGLFTALAAEDHVSRGAVECRAAAQDRTFMQTTDRTDGRTLFAGVTFLLNVTAQTTQRDLEFGMVRVRNARGLLRATGKSKQPHYQSRYQHA